MNAIEAARQGDSQAIMDVLNHLLQTENIVVTNARIQGDYLNLTLEVSEVPLPESSIKRIYDTLKKLDIRFVRFIAIAAVNPNNPDEIWKICIDLTKERKTYQAQSSTSNKFKWPVWFPYPSSWVRMIVLILWLAIVVRVLGFWGMIIGETLSDIVDHPKPLLQAVGLAAFGSILIFSYLYFLVSDQHSSSQKKSFPTVRSLWEGIYTMIVLILSFIITILITFPFLPWDNCYYSHFSDRLICNYSWYSASEDVSVFSFFVWLISGLYLYQIEYIIRNQVPLKRIIRFIALVVLSVVVSILINTTVRNWDNLYTVIFRALEPSPVAAVVETEDCSENDSHEENEEFTDSQEYDPFDDAFSMGMKAAMLGQSAKTQQEWNTVSEYWEEAIQLLEEVSESSLNFETALNKIEEYQQNLNHSQKMAVKLGQYEALIPPDLNFEKAVEEASNAAFFVQTAKSKDEWEFVAMQWQNAINYMKQVQPSDPNYTIAQNRVVKYQKNLEYARLAGNQAKE